MQILRSASLCALTSFFLFSCNLKTSDKKAVNSTDQRINQLNVSPNELMDLQPFQTAFIDNAKQYFSISSKRQSSIKSKSGLKVSIDPSRLEKEDGTPLDGNIDITIIELTNVNDLFRCNAATVSNGKMLASGGSYFIGMENKGTKMRIKKDGSIQVDFPVLKNEDMELFYGKRNALNDMNWEKANTLLQKQFESIDFTDENRYTDYPTYNSVPALEEWAPKKVYKSLDETVYYYKKKMTLGEFVDTINKNDTRVSLQTISYWPKNLPTDKVLDTHYLTSIYGPRLQYILKTCSEIEKEDAARKKYSEAIATTNVVYATAEPKSLARQIQKYYTTTNVTYLGWINCDRFIEPSEKTDTEVELPYTFNNTRMEYFILFRSINSLLNNRVDFEDGKKPVLNGLPIGQAITLIAFIKKNGTIYQAKKELVIEKNEKLSLDFKEISAKDLTKIFGSNVKI